MLPAGASYVPDAFVHRYPPRQEVHFGAGEAGQLGARLAELDVRRALLCAGPNIAETLVDAVIAGAGGRIESTFRGICPHTPASSVDAAAELARAARTDALISLGGGSTHDTIRAVAACLETGRAFLEHFPPGDPTFYRHHRPAAGSPVTMVAIPSTLSAAETTFGAGVTAAGTKYLVFGDDLYIGTIVLDVEVFATTPLDVLLRTGMNAMNHAVERLCSPRHQPIGDAGFVHSLQLLVPGLRGIHDGHPSQHEDALIACILGAHLSDSTNVLGGIGHAIAHVLGGRHHVGHGEANGIVMPHAVAFAGRNNGAAVALLAHALLDPSERDEPDRLARVSAAIGLFVASLGLPGRLRDVGVEAAELPGIADAVLADFSVASARPGTTRADVIELLDAAW